MLQKTKIQTPLCFSTTQFVWGSKRWLAYGYYYFIGDSERAKRAYEDCIEYDPARVDCVVFLSRLYLDSEYDSIALCFLYARATQTKGRKAAKCVFSLCMHVLHSGDILHNSFIFQPWWCPSFGRTGPDQAVKVSLCFGAHFRRPPNVGITKHYTDTVWCDVSKQAVVPLARVHEQPPRNALRETSLVVYHRHAS